MKPIQIKDFTDAKQKQFAELESAIAQKLMTLSSVAQDLTIIRNNRLYPAHLTFNDYAKLRWGFGETEIANMLGTVAVIGDLNSDPITKTLFPIHDESIKEFSNLTKLERIELGKYVVEGLGNEMVSSDFIHECKLELFPDRCRESNPSAITKDADPNYMNAPNHMNSTSKNVAYIDPDLDENRPRTPNPNENQWGEDMEYYNYLRSLMGKGLGQTSNLKDAANV